MLLYAPGIDTLLRASWKKVACSMKVWNSFFKWSCRALPASGHHTPVYSSTWNLFMRHSNYLHYFSMETNKISQWQKGLLGECVKHTGNGWISSSKKNCNKLGQEMRIICTKDAFSETQGEFWSASSKYNTYCCHVILKKRENHHEFMISW